MIARRLLPIIVLAAGIAVLAILGDGWVARDRDARLAEEMRVLAEEASAVAAAWEEVLARTAVSLRTSAGGELDSIRLHLAADGAVLPAPPLPPPSAEALALAERARRTGDRLAAAGDTLRAIDAYTFSRAAIADPRLVEPLLLAAAQAALDDETTRAWGLAELRRLAMEPSPAAILGVPVDLVARLAAPGDAAPIAGSELLARIDAIPAPALAALASRSRARGGWTDEPALDAAIAERLAAGDAIARRAPRLESGKPALAGDRLLVPLARAEDSLALPIAVAHVGDRLPRPAGRLELAVFEMTAAHDALSSTPLAGSDAPAVSPVRLDGAPIASLALTDPDAPARRAAIARRARTMRAVLFGVLAIVGGALLATWIALDRQRRLAALRVRLLANVSHELKTPVTSIRMLGELLQDEKLPRERVEEFGRLITRESQRLGRRIEEILETAWARESAAPLARAPVELRAVVDEVAGTFAGRVAETESRLEVISAGRSPTVETNRDALERIVENLLDNALKYGARPGEGARIAVRLAGETGLAQVVVEDEGPGVPAGESERIFEPFYRARFDDFAVPGTGLGLAISRSFAERLGGSLAHSLRPGGGSRFTLLLPCRVAPIGDDRGDARRDTPHDSAQDAAAVGGEERG